MVLISVAIHKLSVNNFYDMVQYILDPNSNFFDRLEKGDISLPDEVVEKCGTGLKSLSSKICKYLCEFAFQKDHYYINDSYIRAVLLFYLDFYGVEHSNINSIYAVDALDYQSLYEWLTKLHHVKNKKYSDEITKSELDHILWYCYKSFDL